MRSLFSAFVLSLLLTATVAAQERYVRFVDEAAKDPSFLSFRTKLIAAVKRRDKGYVLSALDRNVKVSFGGDSGVADFKRYWRIHRRDSKLWDELLAVLSNGGFLKKAGGSAGFSAPFSFDGFPKDLDAFDYNLIFGSAVALRETPSHEGSVVSRLSYNVVKLVGEKTVTAEDGEHAVPTWYFIETLGGLSGYVNAKYVRSPIDYRAIFEKRRGKWKLTAFVAGD